MSVSSIERWLATEGAATPLLVSAEADTTLITLLSDTALRDVEVLSLSAEGKVTIKQVRELLTSLSLTTTHSRRLVFIPAAERLQMAAANALLKTLEEASPSNRFLLTSAYPSRILPTIRSRCQFERLPRTLSTISVAPPQFNTKRKTPLAADEAAAVAQLLHTRIRKGDMAPQVQRTLARLRDFYKAQELGAGEKLASDALLASLLELENT